MNCVSWSAPSSLFFPLSVYVKKGWFDVEKIVWHRFYCRSQILIVPLWVSSLNCINSAHWKDSAKADKSVAPLAILEDTPTKFLFTSQPPNPWWIICIQSTIWINLEFTCTPALMPGWPLWCGVGLAKSSFMEGGWLKSSIHPPSRYYGKYQATQMEPNTMAKPTKIPHQTTTELATAQNFVQFSQLWDDFMNIISGGHSTQACLFLISWEIV